MQESAHSAEGSSRIVEKGMDIMGGYGISKHEGLERLFRDARLGTLHNSSSYITQEVLANGILGLDLDELPN